MQDLLWSDNLQWWIDVVEGTNLRCEGRELVGMFPYRFGVGLGSEYVKGLEAGLDTEHFLTEYGPTTLEQTNQYYTSLKNTTYCCQWQGQSWPFSTAVYLGTLAAMARTNVSSLVTPAFFQEALKVYVNTNYKEGVPYTAESHYPTIPEWSGDTTNHSEHYLHSTYMDNIFTNLIGILPTLENELHLYPLIPSNWSYFAVENLPYHGTLLTILWDQTGTHYTSSNTSSGNQTAGLRIYSNGTLLHSQSTLSPINITLPYASQAAATALTSSTRNPQYQNVLANPNAPWGLPSITADYLFSTNGDYSPYESWKMNDGLLWYDTPFPQNYWTQNQSSRPWNTLTMTLPRARKLRSLSLAIIDDTAAGGVLTCPDAIRIALANGSVLAERRPWSGCSPNSLNTIAFAAVGSDDAGNATTPATGAEVETDTLVVQISGKRGFSFAVTEVQAWVPAVLGPRWEAEDGLLGTFVGGFEGTATGLNASIVDGGVQLGSGGWVEIAGVMASSSSSSSSSNHNATTVSLVLVASGTGAVVVRVNWLVDYSVVFSGGAANYTLPGVHLLTGGNYITIVQSSGTPWVDAIVVS